MTVTPRRHPLSRLPGPLAAALFLSAGFALAADIPSKTLVTTDGTLYEARTGTVADLGITNLNLDPGTFVIEWASLTQDGTQNRGVLQGSPSSNPKTSLDLTFDEPTGSFVILWRENASIINQLRLAVMRSGVWSFADLIPNMGFPLAFNPRMLLSHQTVTTTDDGGKITRKNRSILSVIWWEEASYAQARYAPIFLDEEISMTTVKVYDLPTLVGSGGPTVFDDVPSAAYVYPALQLQGPGGAILASFADLASKEHYVVRIDYPTSLGNPADPKNPVWERRRIPVVGIAATGPIAFRRPVDGSATPEKAPVGTIIGSSYNPTLYWNDGTAVRYVRFDGQNWSDSRALALGGSLTYEKAQRLLEAMAARN
jgi:hypothetical protein